MKDDRVYLLHIQDAIQRIARYTTDGRDAFFSDQKTQDAVVRNLEIIGEAVEHLSPETTAMRPDVPWKEIAGMRDVADPPLLRSEARRRLGSRRAALDWLGSSH